MKINYTEQIIGYMSKHNKINRLGPVLSNESIESITKFIESSDDRILDMVISKYIVADLIPIKLVELIYAGEMKHIDIMDDIFTEFMIGITLDDMKVLTSIVALIVNDLSSGPVSNEVLMSMGIDTKDAVEVEQYVSSLYMTMFRKMYIDPILEVLVFTHSDDTVHKIGMYERSLEQC